MEEDIKPVEATIPEPHSVVAFVEQKFSRAKTQRRSDEERWETAYRNYRGLYGPDVQFTEAEKSRIFVKVTKTKVLAAYGQIIEVLFGNNKFPISVDPTTLPDGVVESVHFDPAIPADAPESASEAGQRPEERLQPGDTMDTLRERLGPLQKELEPVADKLKEGPGKTPTSVTFNPAEVAAKKMQKKIHDQLEESQANKQLRMAAFECALFGTGIMKGPYAEDKEYPRWSEGGVYDPIIKTMPKTEHVSIWDFYPDPDAYNMDEAEWVVQRHKYNRAQLRNLKRRPMFDPQAINEAIRIGESYTEEWWESAMQDGATHESPHRFEVLEFWGFCDTDLLEQEGITIPSSLKKLDQVSANIWVCNGQVLRAVLNPYKPSYLPYYACPYELNPYSFFGVGVAENMDDTQTIMNGFMRMAVDNMALSGNLLIEVDETNLVPGQDFRVYPGKVFRRQGGAPGQSIFGTKFPNVANECLQLFDKARQLSDESTGFPSFAHGQTGVTGVGRTASGISMLMSAASGSIRNVVKNLDDYLLGPLGKAFFHFNMQFNYDEDIVGDLEVKAQGTESLMANEVRSQRLMQFLSVVQSPELAPFAKMPYIVREVAKTLDLDPDKVANDINAAAIQAEIMKQFQAPPPEAPPGMPGMPSPMDTQGSGNGTIGTGSVPTPGEQGFSGAPENPEGV